LPTTGGVTGGTFGTMKLGSVMIGESCGAIYIVEIMERRGMSGKSCRESIGM
jgi:hypothetical protein